MTEFPTDLLALDMSALAYDAYLGQTLINLPTTYEDGMGSDTVHELLSISDQGVVTDSAGDNRTG